MVMMPGNHNAEHIKEAIESIANSFEFDKSKLCGTVSDEGSACTRLFKQIEFSIAAFHNSTQFPEINFEPEFTDEGETESEVVSENSLLCFNRQIDNELVNYDYSDNEDYNLDDNCETYSFLNNVDTEINVSLTEVIRVLCLNELSISQTDPISTDEPLLNIELANFDDEYEQQVNIKLPLTYLSILLGK